MLIRYEIDDKCFKHDYEFNWELIPVNKKDFHRVWIKCI